MLTHLSIANYALISQLEIDFESGFSVLTGETGAGKSIILGALGLIMGQRADSKTITDGEQKCCIEACFDIQNYNLHEWFEQNDLDYDKHCLIRRELLASGKSRAFVNDTPASLQQLKELTHYLIDIHSQHENLLIGSNQFQLQVVDTVAKNDAERTAYAHAYAHYKEVSAQLQELELRANKQSQDTDYIQFQFDQLNDAQLEAGEAERLEEEIDRLNHTEDIKRALVQVLQVLDNEEQSTLQNIKVVAQGLQRIADYLPQAGEIADRLYSTQIELQDICYSTDQLNEETDFDPQRLQWVTERLDLLNTLMNKHHVNSDEELLQLREQFEQQLQEIDSFDDQLKQLKKAKAEAQEAMLCAGRKLSKTRRKEKENIENRLKNALKLLGIPHPEFQIEIADASEANKVGLDIISFLFAANKNQTLRDVTQVASGGEISRLMLCIKALLAESQALPTLIFDEIDTGVSGEVADAMGRIMHAMGQHIQLLAITHLPQIAAKGQAHYFVYKQDNDLRTESHIRMLNAEERVQHIARMISGAAITPEALRAAEQLLSPLNKS